MPILTNRNLPNASWNHKQPFCQHSPRNRKQQHIACDRTHASSAPDPATSSNQRESRGTVAPERSVAGSCSVRGPALGAPPERDLSSQRRNSPQKAAHVLSLQYCSQYNLPNELYQLQATDITRLIPVRLRRLAVVCSNPADWFRFSLRFWSRFLMLLLLQPQARQNNAINNTDD